MALGDKGGLQFLTTRFGTDPGALASVTAVQLSGTFGTSMAAGFLIKQIQMNLAWLAQAAGDEIIIGFANGSATVTEIKNAIEGTTQDPNDASSVDSMARKAIVFWETLRMLSAEALGNGNLTINEMIRIGGGKGLPIFEDKGIQLFAYNPSSAAITTGSLVAGVYALKGVWLSD